MNSKLVIVNFNVDLTHNNTKIYWDIIGDPVISSTGIQFEVYSSLNEKDWTLVANVSNTFFAVDNNYYNLGSFNMLWYKVKMTASQIVLESQPLSISKVFYNKFRVFRLYNEIGRKFKLLGKVGGEKCIIYRRKRFGIICPNDADPLGGLSQKTFCPVCFGTGIDGGYFVFEEPGFFILMNHNIAEPVTEIGRLAVNTITGFIYSKIDLFPNDLIRLIGSDEIYEISSIKPIEYGGPQFPVFIIQANLKPKGHVVYNLNKPNIE